MKEMTPQRRRALASAILKGALGHEPEPRQVAWALARAVECESLEDFVQRVATTASTQELKALARKSITLEAELATVYASFFWQASRPLRAVAARLSPSFRKRLRSALAGLGRMARPRDRRAAATGAQNKLRDKADDDRGPPAEVASSISSISSAAARSLAAQWCTTSSPRVSIIIVNKGDASPTLACVNHVWANTDGVSYEIIVTDNGSGFHNLAPFLKLDAGTRLIDLGVDRFRGEARNIATESATGQYLCFLDNGATVQKDWLTSLISSLNANGEHEELGAVGPVLVAPDGQILSAGSVIDPGGEFHRADRDEGLESSKAGPAQLVDHVSGAAMLVPRDVFLKVGGFDLAYEPAFYEDADFCLKLRLIGLHVRCCQDAAVTLTGAPAGPNGRDEGREAAVEFNRGKFIARWGSYLKTRSEADLEPLKRLLPRAQNVILAPQGFAEQSPRRVAIYTPFDLRPGGGERYILTLASVFARDQEATFVTSHPYSRLRLDSLADEFGIDVSRCKLTNFASFARGDGADVMVVLGNHVIPPIRARAPDTWYVCQFPFPVDAREVAQTRHLIEQYRGVIVYSNYAKEHMIRALASHGLDPLPVQILHPPVLPYAGRAERKKSMILSVGRFFSGVHNKRHDAMIEIFRDVVRKHSGDIELHLAGSSLPEPYNISYLANISERARGLPVKLHVNPTRDELSDLYRDAALYWHATGLDVDLEMHPEKAEHFGIAIVEAMSAEAVPIAFSAGGPTEIIRDGIDGYLYTSRETLVERTLALLQRDAQTQRVAMARAASKAATRYSPDRFAARASEIFGPALAVPRLAYF